ncbi:MAG: T9SS type A sorting domain-containing protein, partial [Bacteroidota bacterium]
EALDLINVVPNPYYAFSEYETGRIDNRIKFTNLPENCTIKIYNLSGKLVKTFKKSNPLTFQDWTLINEVGIPVASGIYLIHVDVPNVGERILKSFIATRAPDMEGF